MPNRWTPQHQPCVQPAFCCFVRPTCQDNKLQPRFKSCILNMHDWQWANYVDLYSIECFLYLVPSNTSNLCGPWVDKQKDNEFPWAPSGILPLRGRSRRKWSLFSWLARARLGQEIFLCSCSCRGWLHGSSPILARSSRSSWLCLTRGQTLTLRTRWS